MFREMEQDLGSETSDKALALLAAKGDGDAFRQLLERNYDLMFRIAYRLCGHREQAEDITQDVCMSLPARLKSFKGEAAFSTWIYRVVVNKVKDDVRKVQTLNRKLSDYAQVEEMRRGEAADAENQAAWLDAMLARLPDDLRETAVLVVGEGLSQQQAGEILGVKEGTIAWRMSELKKALRGFAEEEA